MIRITSIRQALSLKGVIPELAIIRTIQFMGDGYSPEEHGHIIVIQKGDDITQIKEIGDDGLFIDDIPTFEYVQTFLDGDSVCLEIVLAVDADRTIAVFGNRECLGTHLFSRLQKYSSPIQPMPLKEVTSDADF